MPAVEVLRNRTGFYAWLAWTDGIGDWANYGKKNPSVRPSVPRNVAFWRPSWFARREAWWELRHKAETPKTELLGVIRTAGNATVDHAECRAFLAAGGKRVLLQFRDSVNDAHNRELLNGGWGARWRAEGARVDGWWRVNQSPSNTPPQVLGVDGWWPNAEDNAEIARLPEIYRSPCVGVLVKGKSPGAWPPPGGIVGAECFKESAASDHTITNSHKWWHDAGLPAEQFCALLQMYGTPFSPPAAQALEAKRLGVRTVGFYPLDGADPAGVKAAGEVLA